MVLAVLLFWIVFVEFSKRCVVLDKLRAEGIAENNNEYKNIVLDSNTYTNTFFFVAKKKGIQKRNKRIGSIRLRRLFCF